MSSTTQEQTEGPKQKQPQFYGFTDAYIPTSFLASTSSTKPKKRKTKKDKKVQQLKRL